MYCDEEETNDTFNWHSSAKENQSSAEDLKYEIEKLKIKTSKLQNE